MYSQIHWKNWRQGKTVEDAFGIFCQGYHCDSSDELNQRDDARAVSAFFEAWEHLPQAEIERMVNKLSY